VIALLIAVGALAQAQQQAAGREPQAVVTGGRVYRAKVEAGGAQVAVWRYAAAGTRKGPPVLLLPELGFDRRLFDLGGKGLALALQARGHDVFVLEWRGTGQSSMPLRGMGGLDALFDGDAPAALRLARATSPDGRVQVVGVGLGGAAAYLLGSQPDLDVAAVVAISVPAFWGVPNEALRNLGNTASTKGMPSKPLDLRAWARLPAPVGDGKFDLFDLLLAYGNKFTREKNDLLRAGLGQAAPELISDVWRWMQAGDLPRGRTVRASLADLTAPLLAITALRDNLVHPEHALAVRTLAPKAPRTEIILQLVEGYPEDAGHLAVQAPWAEHDLFPKIAEFLEEHP
jgi:pimeloyl-ACP methyl ester carboxylesterase